MKDQIIYLPTAALGLILILIYVIKCWKKDKIFNVSTTINIVLQAAGVVAGVLLIVSTFYEELRSKLAGIDLYVLISGIAVFAVSFQGIHRDVFSNNGTEK